MSTAATVPLPVPASSIFDKAREARDELLDIIENETDPDDIRSRLFSVLRLTIEIADEGGSR